MPIFNVHLQKELPQNRRVEPSEASEKDAKDLGFTENSSRSVSNEPRHDPESVGSSIVRRNEPDDED